MHEYSIVRALLDRVEQEARQHNAAAVERIRVRVGEQSGVEMDLLEKAFELARMGTICSRAELEVVPVPLRWQCPSCERSMAAGEVLRCERCARPAQLVEGDEIILERLEMEVA